MKKPGLPEWCATHSFKEFLELIADDETQKTGWDAFADAIKSKSERDETEFE